MMTEPTGRGDRPITDDALETLFAAGRATGPAPSQALMARVMADAMAETEARRAPAPPRPVVHRPQRRGAALAALVRALGGWPSMAGLVSAGVVGLWVGYAGPAGLEGVAADMLGLGYGPADLMQGLDSYLQEG